MLDRTYTVHLFVLPETPSSSRSWGKWD